LGQTKFLKVKLLSLGKKKEKGLKVLLIVYRNIESEVFFFQSVFGVK
jgi:hypothetical protein